MISATHCGEARISQRAVQNPDTAARAGEMEAQPSQAKAIDPEMKVEKVDAVNSLKPQNGHDIGFQAPISTRSAWVLIERSKRCVWGGAGLIFEKCARNGQK